MKFFNLIVALLACFLLNSCEVINPDEKIPTYVHIDSFSFVPTPNTGTSSQKITTAWVYFDTEPVGVFELPATFPILMDKPGKLTVTPGIMYSGLSNAQTQYPFFLSDTMTISPATASGSVINFIPKTRYISDSLLKIVIEDFEEGNSFLTVGGDTGLVRVSDPSLVFEKNYAGYIHFANNKLSENIMSKSFTARVESFLELNYKCSLPFEVGLQSTNASGQYFTAYLYGFKPRSEWNKVYVGLQDFITQYPNKEYRVVIRVGPFDGSTGYVSLDNLKVITKK